jgi:hypothetical protein
VIAYIDPLLGVAPINTYGGLTIREAAEIIQGAFRPLACWIADQADRIVFKVHDKLGRPIYHSDPLPRLEYASRDALERTILEAREEIGRDHDLTPCVSFPVKQTLQK